MSAYGNNSRKRTALLTDTFFNSLGCPLTRELTVVCFKNKLFQSIRPKFSLVKVEQHGVEELYKYCGNKNSKNRFRNKSLIFLTTGLGIFGTCQLGDYD